MSSNETTIKTAAGFVIMGATAFRVRSCITCADFEESSELCFKAGRRPPAKVIAQGCEEYNEDIPF